MRHLFMLYGIAAHVGFFAVLFYGIGFVGNVVVPKTIDAPIQLTGTAAWIINIGMMVFFGLQHSLMARPSHKRVITQLIPEPIERSTYVMVANVTLVAFGFFWQPIDSVVWSVQNPVGQAILWGLFGLGWTILAVSSLLINHFDLFGTRQVYYHWKGQPCPPLEFRVPGFYRYVRHPLYVGWIMAFWAIPTMTAGHLLFSLGMTAYILIAVRYEERDLEDHFGDKYAQYRKTTPMLIPKIPSPENWAK